MDNLRSLRGSLPATPSSRRHRSAHQQQQQPPEHLLQAFKTAALSVTNLYRAATSDVSSSYSDGYRDALEDLINFLDKENLGLNDGEGWRVRQWVTERKQSTPDGASEDEEAGDGEESEKRARSSSPILQQKMSNDSVPKPVVDAIRSPSPPRSGSAPPAQAPQPATTPFTFQASHQYPAGQGQDVEMGGGNGNGQVQGQQHPTRPTRRHGASLRSNHNLHNRAAASLGSGAGAKRKLPFIDFFDISGFSNNGNNNNRRDGEGGGGSFGKRSRLA